MKQLRGSYSHRGDVLRGRRRIRHILLGLGFVASLGAAYANRAPEEARAQSAAAPEVPFYLRGEARRLQEELNTAKGELDLAMAQLDRATRIIRFSTEYRIGADLAESILEIAQAEGLDPFLAFRLVKIESNFNERALSYAGAIGLAQVMPGTAKYFEPDITREKLYDRETNLRIGFRYLRALIEAHQGDIRLALLSYNRGPGTVLLSLRAGVDPGNGYARAVMKGYDGRGVLD